MEDTRAPAAVAVANASLLGVGYLMLGRHLLAVVTGLVSLVLVILLGTVAESVWFVVVVLLWWIALIAHGWVLARGAREPLRGGWDVALGFAVPVLLFAGLLRFEAFSVKGDIDDARGGGDCAKAVKAQDGVWFGVRAVDPAQAARGDDTAEACKRLILARERLRTGLTGDAGALRSGFEGLSSVLSELPGHRKMVEVVLDGFLRGLPAKNPCETVAVTDWLRQRRASGNALDRAAGVVPRTEPPALVQCGDNLMAAKEWEQARTRYQGLLDRYPAFESAAKAKDGVWKATLEIELANVRRLLQDDTGGTPEYCSSPAKYSGAPAYKKGTNRALFYGDDEYTKKLPGGWKTDDVTKAVLVICTEDAEMGKTVQTCPYENKSPLSLGRPTYVKFRRVAIPVKAYELRTGKLVSGKRVEIEGSSCPSRLRYTRPSLGIDTGPPSEVHVKPSDGDIREGFESLVNR
ncbi:tetratricopeptide repeat protein [Spirillospora sp. CA-294931]|uniref:tetratricopeptide repeat protein n=1 Tax=Spirillospora sp. CA-294931 TaxID=3240042 RepID=UPI003D8FD6C9